MATWTIDPTHSEIGFRGKHMMISTVRGKFEDFDANLSIDENNPENSSAEFRIKVNSVDTGVEQRDQHLKSSDFFDAENYPEIVFKTKDIKKKGEDVEVTGDLTIKDVTKPVTFKGEAAGPIKDPWGAEVVGVTAETEVNRKEWGLDWNVPLDAGRLLVGDKITLHIEAEMKKDGDGS